MIADHENAGSLALLCNFPLHTLWSFDVAIEKCLFKVVIIELNGSTMFKGPWLPWQLVYWENKQVVKSMAIPGS
jgi:hypothetical protein